MPTCAGPTTSCSARPSRTRSPACPTAPCATSTWTRWCSALPRRARLRAWGRWRPASWA